MIRRRRAPDRTFPGNCDKLSRMIAGDFRTTDHRTRDTMVAVAMLVVAMSSVQLGASFAKTLFPILGAHGATLARLSIAGVLMCAVMRPWRHVRTLTARQWRFLLAYGTVLGVMNVAFYMSLERIPLGVAVAVEFTGPLTVALLASRKRTDVLWAVLAATGLVLISVLGASERLGTALDPIGVVYALVAGVCWGLYIVIGQRAGEGVPASVVSSLGMLTAALVAIPLCAVGLPVVAITGKLMLMALALALLSSAIPYSLEMVALQRLPAKTFGILMSAEPAIGAVVGLAFLHEQLGGLQWIGIACVVAASAGSAMTAVQKAAAEH
jgi:inner membrane transporter RhtA